MENLISKWFFIQQKYSHKSRLLSKNHNTYLVVNKINETKSYFFIRISLHYRIIRIPIFGFQHFPRLSHLNSNSNTSRYSSLLIIITAIFTKNSIFDFFFFTKNNKSLFCFHCIFQSLSEYCEPRWPQSQSQFCIEQLPPIVGFSSSTPFSISFISWVSFVPTITELRCLQMQGVVLGEGVSLPCNNKYIVYPKRLFRVDNYGCGHEAYLRIKQEQSNSKRVLNKIRRVWFKTTWAWFRSIRAQYRSIRVWSRTILGWSRTTRA